MLCWSLAAHNIRVAELSAEEVPFIDGRCGESGHCLVPDWKDCRPNGTDEYKWPNDFLSTTGKAFPTCLEFKDYVYQGKKELEDIFAVRQVPTPAPRFPWQ